MKKKLILMGIAGACVITTAVVGGTLASQNVSTDKTATAAISTKELKIGIFCEDKNVSGAESNTILVPEKMLMPGVTLNKDNPNGISLPLTVKNNTANGYNAYIRVHIYRTWLNGEEKLSDLNQKDSTKLEDDDAGIIMAGWTENWIKSEDESTNEDIVLYYKLPVEPGTDTDIFLDSITVNENLGNTYADKQAGFEVEADAVQALPAEDNEVNQAAIMSAWGMEVSFEENSNIIADIQ